MRGAAPLVVACLLVAAAASCAGGCARARRRGPVDLCGRAFCLSIGAARTLPGVGRAQGVSVRDGTFFVYGDAGAGVIRAFRLDSAGGIAAEGGTLVLTSAGDGVVSHPTGLAWLEPWGAFLGNTVGGHGEIFTLDWERLLAAGTLDGAVRHRIDDRAAHNGSRPELVRAAGRALIASADYGGGGNEVRLYDPAVLATAATTAHPGAVVARFPAGAYVQSLHYLASRDVLVLVQNRRHGSGWRLTFLALAESLANGRAEVLDVLEPDLPGELEGFALLDGHRGLLVTSARTGNARVAVLSDAPRSQRSSAPAAEP